MLTANQVERHRQEMRDQGFTVVRDAIEPDLRRDLLAALERLEQEEGFGYSQTEFEGTRTVRIYNLLAHDAVFQRIPVHENVLPVAEAVLDPELLLSSLSAITLGPGQAAQPLHSDTQMISLPRPHVPITVNSIWALTDFTEANGATRVVPGSHKFDHIPDYRKSYEDTIAAEMPAGSVMLFDAQLWHGGGANRTQEKRFALACYYCAGWLRQQENQQLGIPVEVARGFERRLQELCGYSVYRGIYGHIANQDPITLLGRERRRGMVWEASDKSKGTAAPA